MNKQQKKERRKAQREKGQRFNSFRELGAATHGGANLLNESTQAGKSAPTTTITPPTVASTIPPATTQEVMTKAGVREYNDFFGLYAKSVRERRAFRPLGFIPGPAVLLNFREGGEVQVFAATSDVARGLGTIPTPWMAWGKLPEKIRQALGEWKAVVDGLDYEPSPYNLGIARGLLEGRAPSKHLAMVMPRFRYRPGDPELPLGVALLPVMVGGTLEGLKVKIFNPKGIPDMPSNGAVLKLDELKNGKGPIQKLLRTSALMEGNFLSRYDREGNRRNGDQSPHQPAQHKVEEAESHRPAL